MSKSNLSKRHALAFAMFAAFNFAPVAYAVSTDIVISEFRTRGPSGGNDEFVELYNLSSNPVNIGGWKINGSNNVGATGTRLTIPANTTLNPGCRFLATNSAASGYSGVVGGNFNYSTGFADDGGVALLNASNVIIDAVGMSAGSAYKEGTTLAATGSNLNQSQERKPLSLNNQDTDNNANDFSLNASTSNPQNLSSSCTPLGTITVNLSVSTNTANETGTTVVNVTATTSSAVVGNQTVNLAVSGTGITVGDYALSNTVITIPNGSSTGAVTFTVVDDALVEGTETAILTIGSPSAGISLGSPAAQNIAIFDNDVAPGNACGDPATKISAVQGSGASTPLSGIAGTTIEGIVVGDYQGDSINSLRGFFVQEETADADANPATSEGILVFDGTNGIPNVSVGDKVRVTGTPTEFFNMTEMSPVTSVQVCASNQAIPTAAILTLPVPNIPNGDLAVATTAINNYYEMFEGMLVTFPTKLKVSEYFELERYGQLILSQGGRIPTFTNVSDPSAAGLINHNIKLARRQIILDDNNNTQNFYVTSTAVANNIPLPYPTGGLSATNKFRGGDTISNLTGVLHWSFAGQTGTDAWRIRPVEQLYDYVFQATNPRKNTSPNVGGSLKVTGFNVLNYFTTIDTTASSTSGPCGPNGVQDCRGADSASELSRQTTKAATAICGINADIVGLMEIENNATASLSALVAATNVISGCGPYNFINTGTIGGDAIKVALLYKSTTVSPVGTYQLLTSSVDVRFIDTKNRPTLAQTFSQIASGEKLTVAVNHLKSKGSACTDVGDADANDGQGNCNVTRKNAALALMDWLNSDPTGSGDPDFLIIGDLNSYAKEDPIKAIENGPDDLANTFDDYTNLIKAFGGNSAYSYVFDGQTGYLDHALASKTLLPQVTRAADWHVNADEPPSFDYNDSIADIGEASFEARPAALPLYAADQYRTSDHDPVVIGLQLTETINIIDGTSARNTLNGTAGKDRITGFGGADVLTGGLNADEFVYATTGDGIDTITDFTLGQDKIVVTALLQSLGYQGANPLTDGIVKFAASGSNTVVYIDPDGSGSAVQRALIVVNNIGVVNLNNVANFIF